MIGDFIQGKLAAGLKPAGVKESGSQNQLFDNTIEGATVEVWFLAATVEQRAVNMTATAKRRLVAGPHIWRSPSN